MLLRAGKGYFTNTFLFSLSHSWKKLRQPAANRSGTRAANTKTCPHTQENYLLVGSSSRFEARAAIKVGNKKLLRKLSGLGEFTVLLACVFVALNGTFRRFILLLSHSQLVRAIGTERLLLVTRGNWSYAAS